MNFHEPPAVRRSVANTLARLRAKYPADQKGVWRARSAPKRGGKHLGFYSGPFSEVVDKVVADHAAKFLDGKVCGDIEPFTQKDLA